MTPVPELGIDVELRRHVAHRLEDRRDVIVADTVATFPLSSESRRLDANYCVRLGNLATRLLGDTILEGRCDARAPGISEIVGGGDPSVTCSRPAARRIRPLVGFPAGAILAVPFVAGVAQW